MNAPCLSLVQAYTPFPKLGIENKAGVNVMVVYIMCWFASGGHEL